MLLPNRPEMKCHLPKKLRAALRACCANDVPAYTCSPLSSLLIRSYVAVVFLVGVAEAVTWDSNWGESVTSAAPSSLPTYTANSTAWTTPGGGHVTSIGSMALYELNGVPNCSTDSYTAIYLDGTGADNVTFVGGAINAAFGSPSVPRDTWIYVSSGSWYNMVGGCFSNQSGCTFEGDSHIQLEGMGVSVNNIIGGNMRDAAGNLFTGDSYVSVKQGNVLGFVFGAGVNAHSNTTSFAGDTHIFIYVPLTTDASVVIDPSQSRLTGANAAIVGGGGPARNISGKSSLAGNTNILIDLTSATGGASSLEKKVIGGSIITDGSGAALLTGVTTMTIKTKNGQTVTGDVVGGSYNLGAYGAMVHGDTANSTGGDTQIAISSEGSFSGMLIGGCYSAGAKSVGSNTLYADSVTQVGSSSISISGGTYEALIVGGSYSAGAGGLGTYTQVSSGAGSVTQAGDARISIAHGSVNASIVGGHYLAGIAVPGAVATIGSISVSLGEESTTTVTGNLYGGSLVLRDTTLTQGDITVTLCSSAILQGSLYAAGGVAESGAASIITGSTTVSLEGGVTFTAGQTLSGGYEYASSSTIFSEGATRTLAVSGGVVDLSDVSLRDFDVADVAAGATLLLGGQLAPSGVTAKTGAGTLTLDGDGNSLEVREGELSIAGLSELSSLNMATGTVLGVSAENLLTVQGTFAYADGLTLDLSSLGQLTAGSVYVLGTAGTLQGDPSSIVVSGLSSDLNASLSQEGSSLLLSVSLKDGILLWEPAVSHGVWVNQGAFGPGGVIFENSADVIVKFNVLENTASGGTGTVTMEGPLLVGSMVINPGEGNTYDYVQSSSQGGTLEIASSLELVSGSSSFAQGTLGFSGSSPIRVEVSAGASLTLADCGGGQLELILAGSSGSSGAVFNWLGTDAEKSSIHGLVSAGDGSVINLQGGALILGASGNSLSSVNFADGSSLELQGDATVSGTLAAVGTSATGEIRVGSGVTLTLASGAGVGEVAVSGGRDSVLLVTGAAAITAGAELRGMLLNIAAGGTLTFASEDALAVSDSTQRVSASVAGSYYTGLTGAGSLGGSSDLLLELASGASTSYSGSMRNFSGSVTVAGSGTQTINSSGTGNVAFSAEQGATLVLGSSVTAVSALSVGNGGTAKLSLAQSTGLSLSVGELHLNSGGTLDLTTNLSPDMLQTAGSSAQGAVRAGSIDYAGGTVNITIAGVSPGLDLTGGGEVSLLLITGETSTGGDVTLNGAGQEMLQKYFADTATLKKQGNDIILTGTTINGDTADFYRKAATSANGHVGAAMLDRLYGTLNPQVNAPDSAAAGVLDAIDQLIVAGDAAAADLQMAAVSGASATALGAAFASDIQRQLSSIRNRTTTMGVSETFVNPDMPYFNAWINAEGNYRTLKQDGTLAGYELNSWGGTIGFDVDFTPNLTCGLALSAMYGDLTAKSADLAQGDLDTYYLTTFARYAPSAWVHTFVASVGLADASLDRTLFYDGTPAYNSGDTHGFAVGLMYEIGYTIPMNEDGSTAIQPIANITYAHSSLDGYTESGSDLAAHFGDQTLDALSLGVGLRAQTVIGENIYNRTSLLEGRILAKFDLGDRRSSAPAGLAILGRSSGDVESAEIGVVGLELGVGMNVPIGPDSGSLFIDGSFDLRADYTNVNATVGYRINF